MPANSEGRVLLIEHDQASFHAQPDSVAISVPATRAVGQMKP
jgi:hypothetical protein